MTLTPAPAIAAGDVAAVLRQGGLVLYMRHPETERGQVDAEHVDFRHCATQRNLSEEGRRNAARIGEALRTVGVTISRAITSEYCRAREAARLMGIDDAEVEGMLNDGGRMLASGPTSAPAEMLRATLRGDASPGLNVLIVAHRPNLGDAVGPAFSDLGEGEIAAFRPSAGYPGFEAVTRIRAQDWTDILRTSRE